MIDLDQVQTLSNDELTSMQNKINKELNKRSGADIDIKRIRILLYKVAKALGCEWISETYPEDSIQDTDKPKKRARKPKTEETPTETVGASQTKLQQATAQVREYPWR